MVSYAHVPGVSEQIGSGRSNLGFGLLLAMVDIFKQVLDDDLMADVVGVVVKLQTVPTALKQRRRMTAADEI
jgi:hypothetical protein